MKVEPTVLDRVAGWLSPSWGRSRMVARMQTEVLKNYYDGASVGRRGASIRRKVGSANTITQGQLTVLRNGSRDLVRNNPHVRRAVEAIVSNTIGAGIAPQFKRERQRVESLERLADRYLETKLCDAAGRLTYHGIQESAFHATVEAGEVLVRRRWRRLEEGLPVPFQYQLLEADYLDIAKTGPAQGGGYIVQGVEFDLLGRTRAYWLYPEHPGGTRSYSSSSAVSARDVLHLYRMDRPGQVRGVPWAAPVMLRVADYADAVDAFVMRQKIAACFSAFIKETYGSGIPGTAREDGDDIIDSLEPGLVTRLKPGDEIEFADPPGVEGYGEFAGVTLREVAAGMGVSYEAMTGDLRGVNFSSGKMGRLEFDRNTDRWRENTVIPNLCDPMMQWFLEGAELVGEDVRNVEVRHIAPARMMIDPPREMRAEREAIRSGQKTFTQTIRERGRDPVEHWDEYKEDLAMLDAREIVVDSDARQRTNAGLGISGGAGGDSPDEEEEDGSDDGGILNRLEDLEDHVASLNGGKR